MSTIVNGYRVFANSLEEAIIELKKPKEVVKEFINKAIFRDELFQIISKFDQAMISKILPFKYHKIDYDIYEVLSENCPLHASSYSILDLTLKKLLEIDREGESSPKKMEVILFPEKFIEEDKNYYLFILSSKGETYVPEKKKYIDYGDFYLSKLKNVKSYKYWDNTDKPNNISHSLWSKRYVEWDKCLPAYNSTYKFHDDMGVSIKIADFNRAITVSNKIINKVLINDFRSDSAKRVEIFVDNYILDEITGGDQAKIWQALKTYKKEDYSEELKKDKIYLTHELSKVLPMIDNEYINKKYNDIISETNIKYKKEELENNLMLKESKKSKFKV